MSTPNVTESAKRGYVTKLHMLKGKWVEATKMPAMMRRQFALENAVQLDAVNGHFAYLRDGREVFVVTTGTRKGYWERIDDESLAHEARANRF